MTYKYGQELPKRVEEALDAYIERIKKIKWLEPSPDLKKETVDKKVKEVLEAFGVEASIEYRSLKTREDYVAAWVTVRDTAWDVAWDTARVAVWDIVWDIVWGVARYAVQDVAFGAQDLLASFTPTYKGKTTFLKLVDLWEMGMYPTGVVDGKFIVYTPVELKEDTTHAGTTLDFKVMTGTIGSTLNFDVAGQKQAKEAVDNYLAERESELPDTLEINGVTYVKK